MGELQERLDALMEQMREAAEASSAQAAPLLRSAPHSRARRLPRIMKCRT